MRLNRRGLLVGAAGMVAQTNLLAAVLAHAATRPFLFTLEPAAMAGVGYFHSMATDPLQPGHAAAAATSGASSPPARAATSGTRP